jgi:predicted ATP-dependent serine protease
LTAGAGALSALAELSTVRASWERRIEAARRECGSLAGSLRGVVQIQAQSNEAVKSGFDRMMTPSGGGTR